jgi:hypothetical protein
MLLNDRQLKHIKLWQASRVSQTVYCQNNGLNKKTFSRWFCNYQALSQVTIPSLIAIDVTSPVTIPLETSEPLRLRLVNGLLLELPSTSSPRWLAELLQCLD